MFPPHFKVVIEDTVWNLKPVSWFDLSRRRIIIHVSFAVPLGSSI